jgi:hypothetical protein
LIFESQLPGEDGVDRQRGQTLCYGVQRRGRAYQGPATVERIRPALQESCFSQFCHRGRYEALGKTGSLGDLGDRAVRMIRDVGEDQPHTRRRALGQGAFGDLHELAAEEEERHRVHIKK